LKNVVVSSVVVVIVVVVVAKMQGRGRRTRLNNEVITEQLLLVEQPFRTSSAGSLWTCRYDERSSTTVVYWQHQQAQHSLPIPC